jgi:hypothetical protein
MAGDFRFRKKSSKFWKKFLIFFIIISIFLFFWFFVFSDYFLIKDIVVNGEESINKEAIYFTVKSELSKKIFWIFPKSNIFLFNKEEIEKLLKERFVNIASVYVEIQFFNKTLILNIKERKGEGFWCLNNDRCFIFDNEGVIFSEIEKPEGSGGLVVEDRRQIDFKIGDKVIDTKWIAFMRDFSIETIPDIWIKSYTIDSEFLKAQDLVANTSMGWSIFINLENTTPGAAANILKVLLKKQLLSRLDDVEYIDIRIPGRAYYKPKNNQ